MPIEVKAPVFPESIEEGTIMTWHKKPGEAVGRDEKLAEIETDKIVLEVAAASTGILETVIKNVGDAVLSGEVIGYLGDGAEAATEHTAPPANAPPQPEAPEAPTAPYPVPAPATTPEPPQPHVHEPEAEPEQETPPGISPAARKLVKEHDLSVAHIKGSGRQGRITKADVLDHLTAALEGTAPAKVIEAPPPAPVAMPTPVPAPPQAPVEEAPAPDVTAKPVAPAAPASPPAGRTDERVPMSRIRMRIAERLVEAQQTAAILTTFNEVNMKPVMDLRQKYKETFEKQHGVRLGFMSFFLKAAIEALRRFPAVNASVEDADIVYHRYYDIGIAVSGPRGLLVPIVRDADRLAFHEIESTIRDFGTRAKENQLGIAELQGGTFTISNGGVFGSLLSTPILNPPQSAILGMHAINERPVAENGEIVIRPVMYLALSYDHRIIDGSEAVQFLVVIKDLLEDPSRLLLQV